MELEAKMYEDHHLAGSAVRGLTIDFDTDRSLDLFLLVAEDVDGAGELV